MKLNAKILIPTLSMILLGLVVVAGSNFWVAKNALESNLNSQLAAEARSLAEFTANWFSIERQREIKGWSGQDIYVRSLEDSFMGRSSRKAASAALVNLQAEYSHYSSLLLAGRDGTILAASDPALEGSRYLTDEQWFASAAAGEHVVSVPLDDPESRPVVVAAAPVMKDGQPAGVVAGVVDLSAFAARHVASISIGRNGYACLVTADGSIIAARSMDHFLSGKEYDSTAAGWSDAGSVSYAKDEIDRQLAYQTIPGLGWYALASADIDELMGPVRALGKISATITVIILLLAGGVIWWTAHSVVRPLKRAVAFADSVAAGDVGQRLEMHGRDEIADLGHALDRMVENLSAKADLARSIADGDLTGNVTISSEQDALGHALQDMGEHLNQMINQVTLTAAHVQEGSAQISESSNVLSDGATRQAASLQEISASMTEIESQVAGNADAADNANALVTTAHEDTAAGREQMSVMIRAIADISESSQKISSIIGVIEDIAFQTNLLALNAAVEAARAGQHGKGFAVVADEVRQLAGRCAKAAQETSDLIGGSVEHVQNGARVAEGTSEALQKIVEGIARSAELISEIATASREQADGIAQVTEGIAQIDCVTQQTTATAEETASATADLTTQAQELRDLLRRFRVKSEPEPVMEPEFFHEPDRAYETLGV